MGVVLKEFRNYEIRTDELDMVVFIGFVDQGNLIGLSSAVEVTGGKNMI